MPQLPLYFDPFRMRGKASDVGYPQTSPNTDDDFNPEELYNKLYHPESAASERLSQLLGQYPQRQPITKLGRIGAGLAGMSTLGHPENQQKAERKRQDFIYGDFPEQLEDWKNQITPAISAASAERASNASGRIAAGQIVSQRQSDRRIDAAIARNQVQERQGDTRLDQARLAAEARQRTADARIEIEQAKAKGGVPKVNPDDGKLYWQFKDGSSIEAKHYQELSQEDRLQLQQDYRLELVRERAAVSPTATKPSWRYDVITDDRPNSPTYGKPVSVRFDNNEPDPLKARQYIDTIPAIRGQAEEKKDLDAKALEVKNRNPKWSAFIKFDKQGRFTQITPPGVVGNIFGLSPDENTYKQIYQQIYGTSAPTKANAAPNQPTAGVRKAIGPKGTVPAGWTLSPDQSGVPAGQMRIEKK